MQFGHSIFALSSAMKLLLLLFVGSLVACKCEKQCSQDDGASSSSVASSSSNSSVASSASVGENNPNSFYLNCSDLDPDKVYLLGTLQTGSGGFDALLDPEDPTKFCVGFDDETSSHVIAESGEIIYLNHYLGSLNGLGDILKFTQDYLAGGPVEGGWQYPFAPDKNDINLGTASNGPLFIRRNPNTGLDDIYYARKSSTHLSVFANPDGTPHDATPYYEMKLMGFEFETNLIGVTSNGSLLIADFDTAIVHVSPDKLESLITPPIPAPYKFQVITSKLFIDPLTNHESVWMLVWYNSTAVVHPYGRWTLDLETLVITDDGAFAPLPEGEKAQASRLNGNGELIQTAIKKVGEDSYDYSVIKRPLLSTNASSSVLYRDSDDLDTKIWSLRSVPFVYIEDSNLVTGQ